MTVKKTSKSRVRRAVLKAKEAKQELLDLVDEQVAKIEEEMGPYEELNAQKQMLLSSRAALLGGSRLTGAGGSRVRQEDVISYVKDHPGTDVQAVADKLGSSYHAIYAHLSRGRDERFLTQRGHWWLRDPKNGINTIEDIDMDPDEDEEEELDPE